MNLVSCRHNPNHKVKPSKLLIHEGNCPDRSKRPLSVCPYNPIHKVLPENIENHKRDCPNKPKVDKETEKEIREYIKSKNAEKTKTTNFQTNVHSADIRSTNSNPIYFTNSNIKSTIITSSSKLSKPSTKKQNSIIGAGTEQDKKREKKLEQKKMRDLVENFSVMNENPGNLDIEEENNSIIDFSDSKLNNYIEKENDSFFSCNEDEENIYDFYKDENNKNMLFKCSKNGTAISKIPAEDFKINFKQITMFDDRENNDN
jgi:hypothetical protein